MLPLSGRAHQQQLARGSERQPHASAGGRRSHQCVPSSSSIKCSSSSSSSSWVPTSLMRCHTQQQQQLQPQHQRLSRAAACRAALGAGRALTTTSSSSSSRKQLRQQQQQQAPQIQQCASSSSSSRHRHRLASRAQAAAGGTPPDPWGQGGQAGPSGADWGGRSSSGGAPPPRPPPPPPSPPVDDEPVPGDSAYPRATAAAAAGGFRSQPVNGSAPNYGKTDWGWTGVSEDWDPAVGLAPEQLADMEADYEEQLQQRRRNQQDVPRDKWITPLLDWQSVYGAFDPDQSRTEDAMADEALTNKAESREALAFVGRLVVIPLVTGALISRAITNPVLSFSLQNNPNAFTLTEHQKLEGAQALHMEETRVKMMMAIGQIPPLNEGGMLQHLHEFAVEFQEEERAKNESNLMTLVSDTISAMVFFIMFVRDTKPRQALFSTIGRLFEGLSDIAKAVLIILVADTLLGYHSEEGWTGFLDLFLGHYGIEVEEENIVLFVGVIPIAIDVFFKYWIFIGLNRISPGAVVTIKQLDRH